MYKLNIFSSNHEIVLLKKVNFTEVQDFDRFSNFLLKLKILNLKCLHKTKYFKSNRNREKHQLYHVNIYVYTHTHTHIMHPKS